MGNTNSDHDKAWTASRAWTPEELTDYQELTYLQKREILHAFKKFQQLAPHLVKDREAHIPHTIMMTLPELAANPFRDRMIRVFSSTEAGDMSFEDFIDMVSVFSPTAPKAVKIEFAFRIYDYNEDDMICRSDLRDVIKALVGKDIKKLPPVVLEKMVDAILEEGDLDEDGLLNFNEFEHVIDKCPNFTDNFRFLV